jgi:hypothetical protein
VTNDEHANAELEHQMKQLLTRIEKEPISDDIRALSEKLQKLLDAREASSKDKP